jgi:hypothetical protein
VAAVQEPQSFQSHSHQGLVHRHEHMHITHHAKQGDPARVEHLAAIHEHEHNHPALDHSHIQHENLEREHGHEAHIHDHARPLGPGG